MNTTITTQPRRMTSDIHHNHRTRASFQSYHGHQPSYNHYHHHPNNNSNYRRASSPILRQYSPPPTRLSIAERFMTLSNTDEKTENEEQRIPASSSRSRISIAEQFMTIPRSPTAEKTMTSDEKVQKDCCCNPSSTADDQLMTQASTPLNIAAADHHHHHHNEYHHDNHASPLPSPRRTFHPYHSTPPTSMYSCCSDYEEHTTPPLEKEEHDIEEGGNQNLKALPSSPSPPSQEIKGLKRRRRKRVMCVILLFLFLIICGLGVFIAWPRAPLIRIDGASLLSAPQVAEVPNQGRGGNVAFETSWLVHASVDNRVNYIPIQWTTETIVKDALTGMVIGRQQQQQEQEQKDNIWVLAPRSITTQTLPIHIDYQARDKSDVTFMDLHDACFERQSMQIQFWVTLHIPALEWTGYKPSIVALPARGGFSCPVD
ncbi:hypothetical protein RO3G_06541 [Lichtheimia corymbifera JMRC:FSU:9682]|uniref:Uncharacterized protein n=1 Tax=Lichtheimia corymbifera JMRC:FSU:9682 TaxID=1263082 RepID=A0A068S9R6_9FUNG|nr:hypothetical protein RO3G_06541 [Lichtheimia corymbifera JMRC:FSU:9682]